MRNPLVKDEVKKILISAKKAGISVRRLALEAGADVETIRRWKIGKNKPGYEKFKKFERAFINLTKAN